MKEEYNKPCAKKRHNRKVKRKLEKAFWGYRNIFNIQPEHEFIIEIEREMNKGKYPKHRLTTNQINHIKKD